MNWPEVQALLTTFKTKSVLLIGDTILDRNVSCKVRGVSAETPTMVLEELEGKTSWGGAACVEQNLKALGALVTFITRDRATKTRFWVDDHKILQVDTLEKPLPEQAHQQIRLNLEHKFKADTITVVSDYRHGFIEEATARFIVEKVKGPLYVSSQVSQETSNHRWYKSANTTFVLNKREWAIYDGAILRDLTSKKVVTGGRDGAWIDEAHASAISVNAVDTCGAGDAFLAAYCLSNSLEFANIWAGLSTLQRGAIPPTMAMLEKWVKDCGA